MRALACTVLLGRAGAAAAGPWEVQQGSVLGFAGSSQGEGFEGRFGRFEADIAFDPADLAAARFDVQVDLASVDSANSERDETLRGPDFFAVDARPTARYQATRFRREAATGGFVAEGMLSLNGHDRPVPLHFRWTAGASGAVLEGRATLDRLDFGLGLGDWADPDVIGHAVEVRTRLLLVPAGG